MVQVCSSSGCRVTKSSAWLPIDNLSINMLTVRKLKGDPFLGGIYFFYVWGILFGFLPAYYIASLLFLFFLLFLLFCFSCFFAVPVFFVFFAFPAFLFNFPVFFCCSCFFCFSCFFCLSCFFFALPAFLAFLLLCFSASLSFLLLCFSASLSFSCIVCS